MRILPSARVIALGFDCLGCGNDVKEVEVALEVSSVVLQVLVIHNPQQLHQPMGAETETAQVEAMAAHSLEKH